MRKPKSHLRNRNSLGLTIGNPKAGSATRLLTRALAGSLVLAAAGTFGGHADAADMISRAGRLFGVGWGDGYHSCRDSGVRMAADLPPKTSGDMQREKRNHAANQAACNNIYPAGTALPNRQVKTVTARAIPGRSVLPSCDQYGGCNSTTESTLPVELDCQPNGVPETHLNYRSLPGTTESVQQPIEFEIENITAYDDAPSFVQPRQEQYLPADSPQVITDETQASPSQAIELALPEFVPTDDAQWQLNPPNVQQEVPVPSQSESSVQHDVPSGWPVTDSTPTESENLAVDIPGVESNALEGLDVSDSATAIQNVEPSPTPDAGDETLSDVNASSPQISLPELDDDLLEELDLDPIPGEPIDESPNESPSRPIDGDVPVEEPEIATPRIDESTSGAGPAAKVRFLPPVMPRKIPSPEPWDSQPWVSAETPSAQADQQPLSDSTMVAFGVQAVKENPFFSSTDSQRNGADQGTTPRVAIKPMDPETEAWKVIRQPR